MLPIDIQGSGKWELFYSNNFQLSDQEPALDGIELPGLFTSRYIVAAAKSNKAPFHWIRAGYLIQFLDNTSINSGIVFPSLPQSNTIDLATKLVKLNYVQLLIFSDLAPSYKLFFEPVRWLKQVELFVWQYTDKEVTSFDLLNLINTKLNNF